MDCFFHPNVPSVAPCNDCARSICATCRDESGTCPSCRLAARIDAAALERGELPGGVRQGNRATGSASNGGAKSGNSTGGAQTGGYAGGPNPNAGASASAFAQKSTAVATVSPETRALVGLGYPFWPLAALALLDPKRSPYVRRQAMQAIGFSFGSFGLYFGLHGIATIPILGISAWPLLPLLAPIYLIAVVVYGFKAWQGEDVRIPLLSDWLDQRWPDDSPHTA